MKFVDDDDDDDDDDDGMVLVYWVMADRLYD